MDEQYWGLTGRPFQLTPDPRFWFETATHRKAMAYLGYGLAQGEGFIVITGDIGAGKTTLVGHLLDTIDRQRIDPIKIVSTAIEAEDLLRIVAGQLGVEPAGMTKAQLLVAIERGLHAVARTGRRALLVVDEAQALPVSALEELRMLSNFQAGGHALLQIVLLGQPEFRDRLHGSDRLEQLRQRVIAIHHLDPMGEDEVADYLAHRLQVVGWRGRPDFAADAFAAFHQGSGGVPRRLNALAARVMLHASIERLDLIDGRAVRAVLRDLHADLPHLAIEPVTEPVARPLPMVREPVPGGVSASLGTNGEEGGASSNRGDTTISPVASGDEERAPAPFVPSEVEGPVAKAHPGWFVAPAGAEAPPQAEPVESIDTAPTRHPGLVPGSTGPREQQAVALAEPWMPEQVRHDEEEVADGSPAHAGTAPDVSADLLDRLARLEGRVDEQDEALRRVLTLLVDWVEADERTAPAANPAPAPTASAEPVPIRGDLRWADVA